MKAAANGRVLFVLVPAVDQVMSEAIARLVAGE